MVAGSWCQTTTLAPADECGVHASRPWLTAPPEAAPAMVWSFVVYGLPVLAAIAAVAVAESMGLSEPLQFLCAVVVVGLAWGGLTSGMLGRAAATATSSQEIGSD